MPETVRADTRYAAFEYVAMFADPVLEVFRVASAIQPLYAVLKKWNITPQDVKYKGQIITPNDPLVSFEIAKKSYTLTLAQASITFTGEQVDWSQAPLITEIIETATIEATKALGVGISQHRLQIIMQLLPEGKSIKDLTKSLYAPLGRSADDLDFYGFLLYTRNGLFSVDKSVADPAGLFVRIQRTFGGDAKMADMAAALNNDENWLADKLGLEIV